MHQEALCSFLLVCCNLEEDLPYQDVQQDPRYKFAMDDEMANIRKMKTWYLVSLLLDKQAITCKWINKKKLGINGEVE
jgi:uncharacterized protein YbaP (TraB family)